MCTSRVLTAPARRAGIVARVCASALLCWAGPAGAAAEGPDDDSAASAASAGAGVPRLVDGRPDLQGVWSNATLTPLERPRGIDDLELDEAAARAFVQQRDAFKEAFDNPQRTADGTLPAGEDPAGYNTFWIDEGERLVRIDGRYRSSLIVEPDDGRIPYRLGARMGMLRALLAMRGMDGPEQRPIGERCLVGYGSSGGPPMLPVLYNNHYQIVQTPGHVLILVEMNHDARIVRVGGSRRPQHLRQWLGDSIGWWEGDTLVVETAGFTPAEGLRAATSHLLYTGPGLIVTERFTRTSADEIRYTFTMQDPDVYREPWHGEMVLRRAEGPIYEYACHEGNYSLPGILAGARAEEGRGGLTGMLRRLLD
jgi:hypothetical protein